MYHQQNTKGGIYIYHMKLLRKIFDVFDCFNWILIFFLNVSGLVYRSDKTSFVKASLWALGNCDNTSHYY